jgi:hypothetical protein
MIEETLEVGPFTPQEVDEVCEKLKSQGVAFELVKDEATEKAEMKNDYENVATKVEWRTHTYLGQVFYLRMKIVDFDRNKEMLSAFGMATTHKESPAELEADITEVHAEAVDHEELKRISARSLVILFVVLILCFTYIALRGV